MELLGGLSSQCGDNSGNRQVAEQCLNNPSLIPEIIQGLEQKDNKIVVDCTEVLTEIALQQPELVAPYGHHLPHLLANKNNRARWEAMHGLALVAGSRPDVIGPMIEQLLEIIEQDKSVILRDYAIDAVGGYAGTGPEAAEKAFPALERSLGVWEGRHARHALDGLGNVVKNIPGEKDTIREIASGYLDSSSGAIKKSAKVLMRLAERG